MDQIRNEFIYPKEYNMGSVGSAVEGVVGGAINTVTDMFGIGGPKKLGTGGSFAMTEQGAKGEEETLKRLRERAAGKGPSITEMQYQKGLEDLKKQQQSAVASARGASNIGLLQRQAMQMGQQANLDIARDVAMAKLAEQRAAEQSILNQAAAQRGVAAQTAASELAAQQAANQTRAGFFGSLAGAGALLARSDKENKKEIKPGNATDAIDQFMNALKSYTYEYKEGQKKEEGTPKGEVTSVMAQDLEKSDIGKQMVIDTPDGKMVNYAQGMAPLFAAIAELNKRTKKLEGSKE